MIAMLVFAPLSGCLAEEQPLADRSPDGDAPSQTTAAFPQPGEVVNGFKPWKNVIFPRLTLLLYSTMERGDYEGWMSVGSHIVTEFYLTPLLRRV